MRRCQHKTPPSYQNPRYDEESCPRLLRKMMEQRNDNQTIVPVFCAYFPLTTMVITPFADSAYFRASIKFCWV